MKQIKFKSDLLSIELEYAYWVEVIACLIKELDTDYELNKPTNNKLLGALIRIRQQYSDGKRS